MNPADTSVCVAWVHPAEVAYSWFWSMMQLQSWILQNGRKGRFIATRYGSGGLVQARNKTVGQFLAGDEEWLMWVDTDMGFTPDAVDRLVESADPDERPVVGGLCFANKEVAQDGYGGFTTFPIPTVYRWVKNPDGSSGFVPWAEYPKNEIVECEGTGSAFILIHRSVFVALEEKLGPTWYDLIPNPYNEDKWLSEDLSFCVRCAEVAAPIHVNTAVKTTHLKQFWASEQHFDMYFEAPNTERPESLLTADKIAAPTPEPKNRAERRRAERKAAKQPDPSFVILGTGRSVSGYISKVLTLAGINCGHENWWFPPGTNRRKNGLVGDSSWIATVDLPDSYTGKVLHQVRNPLRCISSFANGELFERKAGPWYKKRLEMFEPTGDNLTDSLRCYVAFFDAAEKRSDPWWRLEDVDADLIATIADDINVAVERSAIVAALMAVPNNFNDHGTKNQYGFDDLPDCRERDRVAEIAEVYGYDLTK